MRLVNARGDRVIATSVELATSRAERRQGLLGRTGLADGHAIVIAPCFAVHTVGMQFAIDVIFVDARGHVRKIRRDMAPWRMAGALGATAVIELPAGALVPTEALLVGDRLHLDPPPLDVRAVAGFAEARTH